MIKELFAVLASVSITSSLFSATAHSNTKECAKLCHFMPLSPSKDCCKRMHIDIGILYQQPSAGYMFPGIIEHNIYVNEVIDDVQFDVDSGTDLRPCFDYAIGGTVSLGHLLDHDHWYLGARFDWLSASADNSYDVSESSQTWITLTYPYVGGSGLASSFYGIDELDSPQYDKAYYTGTIDYYQLDILLARGAKHSSCFVYEPFAGVKALWFYAAQKGRYIEEEGSNTERGTYAPQQKNWGVGPMFGVNGEYLINQWIALFSDSDIALLYGESRKRVDIEYQNLDGSDIDDQYETTFYQNVDCIVYVPFRTVLGVKLSRLFVKERHHISLKIGYDVRSVFSFQETDRGITLNGLYTDLVWTF